MSTGKPIQPRGRPRATHPRSTWSYVAAALRRLREAAGMTVQDAAKNAGVSPGVWYDWESGRPGHSPLGRLLAAGEAVFGVPPEQMIRRPGGGKIPRKRTVQRAAEKT